MLILLNVAIEAVDTANQYCWKLLACYKSVLLAAVMYSIKMYFTQIGFLVTGQRAVRHDSLFVQNMPSCL